MTLFHILAIEKFLNRTWKFKESLTLSKNYWINESWFYFEI